jgi:hypothetical protein
MFLRKSAADSVPPPPPPPPPANSSHHGAVSADVGDPFAVNDGGSSGNRVEGQKRGEDDFSGVVDDDPETRGRQVTVIVVDGK